MCTASQKEEQLDRVPRKTTAYGRVFLFWRLAQWWRDGSGFGGRGTLDRPVPGCRGGAERVKMVKRVGGKRVGGEGWEG